MSVIGTYILYYLIVIFGSITAWISEFLRKRNVKRLSKWIFFSAIIVPVVTSGLRYHVGTDYGAYTKIYENLYYQFSGISSAIVDSRYEPGWVILNYTVRYTFDDVQFVFLVAALLTGIFSFKAIYDNKDHISVGIAVFILLCTLYNTSFNIVRQVLAISIIMLSIKPMLDKQKLRFILIVLFASCFHFTSLIFLPAYWLVNSKTANRGLLKRIFTPIISIVFVFSFPMIANFITNNIFSIYSDYNLDYSGFFPVRSILINLPIFLLIIFNSKKLKTQNNKIHKLSILFLIGVLLVLLSSYSPYMDRLSLYYDFTQIFIVSAIIKVQSNKYEKFLYAYVFVIYYLARFTYLHLIMGEGGTIPYNF